MTALWEQSPSPHGDGRWFVLETDDKTEVLAPPGVRVLPQRYERSGRPWIGGWRAAVWTCIEEDRYPERDAPDHVAELSTRDVLRCLGRKHAEAVETLMVQQLFAASSFGQATSGTRALLDDRNVQASTQLVFWILDELDQALPDAGWMAPGPSLQVGTVPDTFEELMREFPAAAPGAAGWSSPPTWGPAPAPVGREQRFALPEEVPLTAHPQGEVLAGGLLWRAAALPALPPGDREGVEPERRDAIDTQSRWGDRVSDWVAIESKVQSVPCLKRHGALAPDQLSLLIDEHALSQPGLVVNASSPAWPSRNLLVATYDTLVMQAVLEDRALQRRRPQRRTTLGDGIVGLVIVIAAWLPLGPVLSLGSRVLTVLSRGLKRFVSGGVYAVGAMGSDYNVLMTNDPIQHVATTHLLPAPAVMAAPARLPRAADGEAGPQHTSCVEIG